MAKEEQKPSASRWLYFFGALCLGLPLLVICGLTLVGPPTWETGVLSLAVLIGVVSGLVAPWARPGAWGARLAFLLLFLVVIYRFFAAERSTSIKGRASHPGPKRRNSPIPAIPAGPVPRTRFSSSVSAWSSR